MATAAKPRCRSEARLTWLALAFLTLGSGGVVVIGVRPPVLSPPTAQVVLEDPLTTGNFLHGSPGPSTARVSQRPERALEGMSTFAQAPTVPTPYPKAVVAALGSLVVALVTIVTVFNLVHWSAAQTALVTAEAAAAAGLCGALVAHFMPGTSREPVALAATLTAMISATTALGSGFAWWRFTEQETSALVGVITAILGIGSALFARHHVSPKPPLGRVVAENTPE